ncbi:MAG: response regulator [Nitrospinae bacterium]|nr:response regulator [Nitrospinota bacterium]
MREVSFLVADDSPTIRNLVRKVLETKIGANKIFEANDGSEALNILKEQKIDIILSDWEMPNVSGDELLFQVRNSPDWKGIPFIMMTSYGGKDFIMTAIQNGVTHYLVKPFTAVEMEDRIRKSWNAAAKRSTGRFASLPPHMLMIKNKGRSFPARIIDISCTGALINMEYVDELKLFGEYELALEFEAKNPLEQWAISPIYGTAVRLETDASGMHLTSKKCEVALYFNAKAMDKKVEKKLNDLIKWLASLAPDAIADK